MDKSERVEVFVDAVDEVTGSGFFSYSGRGMNGRHCLAVLVLGSDIAGFTADLMCVVAENAPGNMGLRSFANFFHAARTGDLGKNTVMYFPSIEWQQSWNDTYGVE